MNKLLYFFVLLISFYCEAKSALVKTEVNLIQNKISIDTTTFKARSFDTNFKSKYNNEDFIYEFKPKELNTWDRFKQWLANIIKDIFNTSDTETSLKAVEYFFKTIAVLLIIFAVYLIVKALLNKEGSWIFGKSSNKKIVDYTDIEKNIHEVDFEKLIQKTLQSGDKRLTIRYYYLWVLKSMTSKGLIEWDIEKTNSDYLYEIKNPTIKENFEYASYLYNYIWYGEFALDDFTFEKMKTVFENNLKAVNNE